MPLCERYWPSRMLCRSAMPSPLSLMRMRKAVAASLGLDRELGAAAAGIAEGVARDFGDRSGDAGLVLPLEAEQFGDATGALPHRDDIALGCQWAR